MADIEMKSVRPLVENGGKYNNPGFEDDDDDNEKVVCISRFDILFFNRMYYRGQRERERERERGILVFIIIFQKGKRTKVRKKPKIKNRYNHHT